MPRRLFFLLLGLALVAACDRTPTEVGDVASLLTPVNQTTTLPALFREAVSAVDRADGQRGVDDLLGNWHELQEELKAEAPTASRGALQAKLEAIHNEELRIVEHVLGAAAITRAMSESNVGLAEARAQIAAAEAAGESMEAARSVSVRVAEKLRAARSALAGSDSHAALDAATEASALLGGLRYYLTESRRIPGVESLLPQAIEQLGATRSAAAVADLRKLEDRAQQILRSGDREAAHDILARVRARQIDLVVNTLGTDRVAQLVSAVNARALEVRTNLQALKTSGRDVVRLERMTHEAIDLAERARIALDANDAATALDLGSHAAGLLNAAQHLTWN